MVDPFGVMLWWSKRPYSGAVSVFTGVTQEGSFRGAMVVPV